MYFLPQNFVILVSLESCFPQLGVWILSSLVLLQDGFDRNLCFKLCFILLMMCIWLFLVPCLDPLLHKLKLECGWKHPLHRLHRWIYQGLEDLRVWLCRLDSKSLSKGLGSLCLPKHCNVRQVFDCRELYCPFGTFWSPNDLCFSFVNELIVLWRIYFATRDACFWVYASLKRIYVKNTGIVPCKCVL